ncbi:MAG TPA: hypothetical protein DIS90_10360 [Cytophagales bacterium]|nr:hypothetical protein [Cytophagales bacterium]
MESHKKVLGILYVVSGSLQMVILFGLSMFVSTILALIAQNVEPDEVIILELVTKIIQFLPATIVIFFSLPTIIAGIGILYKQKWAMILALIMGCFKLFSFPIGTALGVYTIWVYAEDSKHNKEAA